MPTNRAFLLLIAALPPLFLQAQTQPPCGWNPDYDGDNTVGVSDLLALLGVFEEVDSDGDGIFDSQDDCVGVYDACGVCGGLGPVVPVLDQIITQTDSVFVPPLEIWYVFTYAVDTLYTYVCPVLGCTDTSASNFDPAANMDDGSCAYVLDPCGGETSVVYDGFAYNLLAIGTQCWFQENLRNDNYRNGDAIPGNLSNTNWQNTLSGAQAVFNNSSAHLASFGRLYNWLAVNDSRGLCPTGYHVPSDGEWKSLELALGMSSTEADAFAHRGTDQGTQMKSSSSDVPAWNGSNTSGYSGLPGGYRSTGFYFNLNTSGSWWSSTASDNMAIHRTLYTDLSTVYRDFQDRRFGLSVRCVKD